MSKILHSPDKPEKDRKDYRIVKLSNGIKALLISDPSPINDEVGASNESANDKLAVCSLCIDVGSFSDPRDTQGMAHFLEHMTFKGSKKYPKENEFSQYIQQSAGLYNAATDNEVTVYYFQMAENRLDGALDRFVNLVKEPLLSKECMAREREAVESEFRMLSNNFRMRKQQLFSSLGNANHPLRTFSCGNLKTLQENISDDELYRQVNVFQKRHYSAHRMYACIQSRLSLDQIQNLLVANFSDIPNNEMAGIDFSEWNHLNTFQDKFSEQVFVLKDVGNDMRLDITFCLESVVEDYKRKAHFYIGFLLEHKGKGSLSSYLRRKKWIMELNAGVYDTGFRTNHMYSLFTVSIELTQSGMNHVKDVLEAVFGYIKYISILDPITTETLYAELQTITANNFHFREEETEGMFAYMTLSVNLKMYPPKDVLTGPNLLFEYDYNAIRSFIDKLNQSKVNVMICTTSPIEGHDFDKVEPWFGTQYCSFDVPTDWSEKLKNPRVFDDFQLPQPNVYIPKDFTILYDPETTNVTEYPVKIMENELCELWYRQDDKHLRPTACYNFYFIAPVARESIEDVVLLDLYSRLLNHKLEEILYPATAAGLYYSSSNTDKGLELGVSGFSQSISQLVDTYIKNLPTFATVVTEEEFRMSVESLIKSLYNTLIKPSSYVSSLISSVVVNDYYPAYEQYETLKTLTLQDFQNFAAKFLTNLKIQGLCQGNLSLDMAKNIMDNVLSRLSPGSIETPSSLDLRVNNLPIGASYLRCASINPSDVNTLTKNLYQIGPSTMKTNSLIDFLMSIAQEPLFNTLRSKEQLGYFVQCFPLRRYGILFYSITLNSQETKFSAEHIDERIEAFRLSLLNIIRETSDSEFEKLRESFIRNKLAEDKSLSSEASRNWAEIKTSEYAFDRTIKTVECAKSITKSELLDFYENHLLMVNTKKLSVQVIGRSNTVDESVNQTDDEGHTSLFDKRFDQLTFVPLTKPDKGSLIQNINDFVSKLETYPVTKTNFDC